MPVIWGLRCGGARCCSSVVNCCVAPLYWRSLLAAISASQLVRKLEGLLAAMSGSQLVRELEGVAGCDAVSGGRVAVVVGVRVP